MRIGHSGVEGGKCIGAVPVKEGVCLYINLNPDALRGSTGFSFTIPLHHFLPEGQMPVCPTSSGVYDLTMSNDATVRLNYDSTTGNWLLGENIVGKLHEVRLPDWVNPAIVVGIKLVATTYPGMVTTVVEETVPVPAIDGTSIPAS